MVEGRLHPHLDEAADDERGELHLGVDRVRADAFGQCGGHLVDETGQVGEPGGDKRRRTDGDVAEAADEAELGGIVQCLQAPGWISLAIDCTTDSTSDALPRSRTASATASIMGSVRSKNIDSLVEK